MGEKCVFCFMITISLLACTHSFQFHYSTPGGLGKVSLASRLEQRVVQQYRRPQISALKTQMSLAIQEATADQYTSLTAIQMRAESLLGIRTSLLNYESWVWSHASRYNESVLLKLTAAIEASGGSDNANPSLVSCRTSLLEMLLRFDYPSYLRACTTLGGLIPRRELPNVQDVPLPASMRVERKAPQQVDARLISRPDSAAAADAPLLELIPDCALPNVTFSESPLDQALLWIFRALVQKETGFASAKPGILGLLEEGREYMLRPGQVGAPCPSTPASTRALAWARGRSPSPHARPC